MAIADVLHNEYLLRDILEFCCSDVNDISALRSVCKDWALCAGALRAQIVTSGRNRSAQAALHIAAGSRGLRGLTVVASNLDEGLQRALDANADLRGLALAMCFGWTLHTTPDSLRTWHRLSAYQHLVCLTLSDVSAAWPRGVALPCLRALALTNSNIALAYDRHPMEDADSEPASPTTPETGGTGSDTGHICASLLEIVRHCPRLEYLALGGARILRQRAPGQLGAQGQPYNPLAETIDARTHLAPHVQLTVGRWLVSGTQTGESALMGETSHSSKLAAVETTFLPQAVQTAIHESWPSARMIDLTCASDTAAVVRSLSRSTYLPRGPDDIDDGTAALEMADLSLPSPIECPGFSALVSLSTSCQQPQSRMTPLHLAVQGYTGWNNAQLSPADRERGSEVQQAQEAALAAAAAAAPAMLAAASVGQDTPLFSPAAARLTRDLLRLQSLLPDATVRNLLLERKDGRGGTVLLRACEAGDAVVVRSVIAAGADLCARNHRDERPLYVAALKGHAAAVNELVKAVRALLPSASASSSAASTVTEAVGPDGWTALHAACLSACLPAVQALLGFSHPIASEPQADSARRKEAIDGDGGFEDVAATRRSRSRANKASLVARSDSSAAAGGDIDDKNGVSRPVLSALSSRPLVDVNARNRYGRTALHVAVHARSAQAVGLLLAGGADPWAEDVERERPSQMAARLLRVTPGTGAGVTDPADMVTGQGATSSNQQLAQRAAAALGDVLTMLRRAEARTLKPARDTARKPKAAPQAVGRSPGIGPGRPWNTDAGGGRGPSSSGQPHL